GANPLKLEDLLNYKAFTPEMAMLMEACIKARLNILISGGTGCGKTTLLNTLSSFIPRDQRVITIEDAAELQLQQDHVVRLESRPPNIEGRGANTPRDAMSRLETMISMAGLELPIRALRQQFASAVDVIIQANRLQGGPRK